LDRRLEGRDGQISYDFAVLGMSQIAIAEKHGISQQRVSQILAENRKHTDSITVADHRAQMLDRITAYRRSMAELAAMEGAPVTAGKDGQVVRDPDTDVVVRDYSGRINATKTMLQIDERLAKLVGTDEPTRTRADVTVHGEQDGQDALAREAAADLDEGPE
jgi:transcriptional regulator with XRE-family HTH domain